MPRPDEGGGGGEGRRGGEGGGGGGEEGGGDGDGALDPSLGLELLAAAGACDIRLTIFHDESEAGEDELPSALLHTLAKDLPFGAFRLPRVCKALHMLPGVTVELKVRQQSEPPVERVNVRRVMNEQLGALTAAFEAAKAAELEATMEKRRRAEGLIPGQLGLRNRKTKLAVLHAKGAREMLEELLTGLPDEDRGGAGGAVDDLADLQFEWLPTQLYGTRKEVGEALGKPRGELATLRPSMELREVEKRRLSAAVTAMQELTHAELPAVTPPLENAGKLHMASLHGAFYHHRELLYARRNLAHRISKFAAELALRSPVEEEADDNGGMGGGGMGGGLGGKPPMGMMAGSSKPLMAMGGSSKTLASGPAAASGPAGFGKGGGKKGGAASGPFGGSFSGGGSKAGGMGMGMGMGGGSGPKKTVKRVFADSPLQRVKALMLLTPSPELQPPTIDDDNESSPMVASASAPQAGADGTSSWTTPTAWAAAAGAARRRRTPSGGRRPAVVGDAGAHR